MDSTEAGGQQSLFSFGEFILCRRRHCLCRGQEQIHLRGKAFHLLVFLLENRGRTVNRQELLQAVWEGLSVVPTTVEHAITEIRHALGDNADNPRFIETVAREGYCFFAQVEKSPGGPLPCETKGSFAILPFLTLGLGADEEWLGKGLADALITRISSLREIMIRPTGAVMKYSGQEISPLDAGRKLEVNAILEGTIQRAGKRIRVTLQLLRVSDGKSLWAETYDEKFQDKFSLEDSICEMVMQTLVPKLRAETWKNS
jgi:DNA-binding winged helix-turn-helix (wHTH) protein